jgi:hypothetical protein
MVALFGFGIIDLCWVRMVYMCMRGVCREMSAQLVNMSRKNMCTHQFAVGVQLYLDTDW